MRRKRVLLRAPKSCSWDFICSTGLGKQLFEPEKFVLGLQLFKSRAGKTTFRAPKSLFWDFSCSSRAGKTTFRAQNSCSFPLLHVFFSQNKLTAVEARKVALRTLLFFGLGKQVCEPNFFFGISLMLKQNLELGINFLSPGKLFLGLYVFLNPPDQAAVSALRGIVFFSRSPDGILLIDEAGVEKPDANSVRDLTR